MHVHSTTKWRRKYGLYIHVCYTGPGRQCVTLHMGRHPCAVVRNYRIMGRRIRGRVVILALIRNGFDCEAWVLAEMLRFGAGIGCAEHIRCDSPLALRSAVGSGAPPSDSRRADGAPRAARAPPRGLPRAPGEGAREGKRSEASRAHRRTIRRQTRYNNVGTVILFSRLRA